MHVDFWVIRVADLYNDLRFKVRRPTRRLQVNRRLQKNRRPPSDLYSQTSYVYIVIGVDSGVLWVADFDNDLRF